LSSERYDTVSASEVTDIGWLVLGFVFDAEGRLLLIDQPWADGWLAPGGVPEPGESLAEAVVREVREETGIEVTPERPHAVDEYTFEHERTGETGGWTTVCFAGHAETTTVDSDPGLADETITDVEWFDGLPEAVHNREWTETVYRRCLDGPTEG
jgi:8-oxo-dGTP diphosphatase